MVYTFHSLAFFCLIFVIQLFSREQYLALAWNWGADVPTKGFVSLPFNRSYYHIQRPYDVPEEQRYSFIDGVHRCWVYSTDKPHTTTSQTLPRTEIAIQGYNYSSGVWEFEAYGYVPNGTSGVCIMQVFGASSPYATTLMLRVYNGSLTYYTAPVLVQNIYNKWFKLNVVHDVDAAKVRVYIDGCLKIEANGRGGASHAFKCGVYAQLNDSYYMESRWKDLKGYGYHSGVWEFEAYAYVPNGTSNVCIMQVFGATAPHASTLMLRVYNGSLTYYRAPVLLSDIYDKWFKINVIHDVDAAKVRVYIDGCLKIEADGRGGTSHAFKCGVYAQMNQSCYMESRWKDIKVLRKV